MTEHADQARSLISQADSIAAKIDETDAPDSIDRAARSGQVRATAAIAAALLDVAAAIRDSSGPWHPSR
jgi:hypothetical protein